MITRVLLPQFELTMESAVVARWLVREGAAVEAEQKLVEIETQKAISDVLAPAPGVVRKICVADGETIPAKALLCVITTSPDEVLAEPALPTAPASSKVAAAAVASDAPDPAAGGGVRASPATRKAARDLSVDLNLVRGTGPAGRITVADVTEFAASAKGAPAESAWTAIPPGRLAFNAQMAKSLAEIPKIVVTRQMDVAPLLRKEEGLTFTHRLISGVAAALGRHPALRTVTDGRRFRELPVSVAVAMDTPMGLVAPVLRGLDLASLEAISRRLTEYRDLAGNRRLNNSRLQDGPFAITNLGMLGVDFFTPFIFDGQTAVLAVGRAVGTSAWFSLAADHRVVDGAEAARFLGTLQQAILA